MRKYRIVNSIRAISQSLRLSIRRTAAISPLAPVLISSRSSHHSNVRTPAILPLDPIRGNARYLGDGTFSRGRFSRHVAKFQDLWHGRTSGS